MQRHAHAYRTIGASVLPPHIDQACRRLLLRADVCPSADAFRIECRQSQVPACGPGGKPFNLNQYCTAFPLGAELEWVRATIVFPDATSPVNQFGGQLANFTTPPVVTCPAGANGTNVWWPFITSFKGRKNCFCIVGQTSCRFGLVGQISGDPFLNPVTFNPAINITVHGESCALHVALSLPFTSDWPAWCERHQHTVRSSTVAVCLWAAA